MGLGSLLGRLNTIPDWTQREYDLSRTIIETPRARFALGYMHATACHLEGEITEAQAAADRVAGEPMDNAVARAHRAMLLGSTALARGDLASACRWFREANATFASLDEAWVRATSGIVNEAITIVHDTAAQVERSGRPAREVWCLQTAAQFGDAGGATRLTELTAIVQEPRVTAAAAHAAALCDGDGAGLLDAAKRYEAFGDRIAAAHASVIHRTNAGDRTGPVIRVVSGKGSVCGRMSYLLHSASSAGSNRPSRRSYM